MDDKIRLGISSCLLGAQVRYDGGHQLLIMAHSPQHYRQMGKLVAAGRDSSLDSAQPDLIRGCRT